MAIVHLDKEFENNELEHEIECPRSYGIMTCHLLYLVIELLIFVMNTSIR